MLSLQLMCGQKVEKLFKEEPLLYRLQEYIVKYPHNTSFVHSKQVCTTEYAILIIICITMVAMVI